MIQYFYVSHNPVALTLDKFRMVMSCAFYDRAIGISFTSIYKASVKDSGHLPGLCSSPILLFKGSLLS